MPNMHKFQHQPLISVPWNFQWNIIEYHHGVSHVHLLLQVFMPPTSYPGQFFCTTLAVVGELFSQHNHFNRNLELHT